MKSIFLIVLCLNMLSCNGQENKDIITNSNHKKMREKIDLKLYKSFEENSDYRYVLPSGNIIFRMSFFNEDGGSQYESVKPPSFLTIYKEFYASGYIKKKEIYIGENVKVGFSEYYDKNGNKKEINEDAKFGKIKPQDALKFLEKKGIINLVTGKGKFDKDGRPTFELNFENNANEKYYVISISNGKPNSPENFPKIGEPPAFAALNYKMDGETGEVEEMK